MCVGECSGGGKGDAFPLKEYRKLVESLFDAGALPRKRMREVGWAIRMFLSREQNAPFSRDGSEVRNKLTEDESP